MTPTTTTTTGRTVAARRARRTLAVAAALLAASPLMACSDDGGKGDITLTMLTYNAFTEPEVLKEFTKQTGITVRIARGGDTGTLVNKAILTKGNPEGDVLWGLDNTLLSRALAEKGLFVPYETPELAELDAAATALVPNREVTPVDISEVCLNYDKAWFTNNKVAPPASLDDLTKPEYKGLLVVENPATSSPGLAFLLATVAKYGPENYLGWWKELRANGVTVVESWDAAYDTEFTQGGSGGTHPIVVSYGSSPPATVMYAPDPKPTEPTIANVDSSCFGQVSFAGILKGSEHVEAAKQLIDFLVSEPFQAALPESNFVYPVRQGVALPALFEQFAKPIATPLTLSPADIAANREEWIAAWTKVVLQ